MAVYDDYLPCKSYLGHDADSKNPGFCTFKDEKTSKFYFALLDSNGAVLLRSEGYKDTKSRKNGIESVIKNLQIDGRLSIIKDKTKFVLMLKAGNNQEIARSCEFSKKSDAETSFTELTSQFYQTEPEVKKTVSPKLEKTSTKTQAKVSKEEKKTIEDTNSEEILLEEPQLIIDIEGFLNVDHYLNKDRIWDSYGITGFVKFRADDGLHYFAVYNPDATLYLRSKGFLFEDDRDIAFDLMESAILLEENYKIENITGKYYAILFEDNEVLAISPDFESFIEAFVTTPGGRPKEYQGTIY